MRKHISILLLILLIAVVGALFLIFFNPLQKNNTPAENGLLGGDRDSHGCIGSAGYTWCEAKEKCLRVWEEECTDITLEDKKVFCEKDGGVWYSDNNVCEKNSLNKEECLAQDGVFEECASACRHDSKAEVCTLQCVQTCTVPVVIGK